MRKSLCVITAVAALAVTTPLPAAGLPTPPTGAGAASSAAAKPGPTGRAIPAVPVTVSPPATGGSVTAPVTTPVTAPQAPAVAITPPRRATATPGASPAGRPSGRTGANPAARPGRLGSGAPLTPAPASPTATGSTAVTPGVTAAASAHPVGPTQAGSGRSAGPESSTPMPRASIPQSPVPPLATPAVSPSAVSPSAVSPSAVSPSPSASSNPLATQGPAIPLARHDLTITKTADTSATTVGATVHYTITVQDTGLSTYNSANMTDPLTDVLDDATYNGNVSATSGTVSFTSPNITWTGRLQVGDIATITYSVTVKNPDTGNGVLANTTTSASAASNCPSGAGEAICTATVTVSGLTIVKTASGSTTTPGATVGYTITVTNSGHTDYLAANGNAAAFSDPLTGALDDASYDANVSATSGTATFSSPNLTWTGDLAAGASSTITYSMTVRNPDPGNGILSNTVTSATQGSNCASGSIDTRCAATVTVSALTIVKTANASTTTAGSTVGYTITVTNSGQTAYTGAAFTDPLTGVTDDATYNNNASASSGTASFTSPNLTWTGNLAVGASVTITYSVTVKNPDTGDHSLSNTVTSATVGNNCASGSTDTRCTVTVGVSELTISKTADVSTTTPGSVVHYTITVTNSGQTAYTGATFTDPLTGVLDDATYDGNASATVGAASYASPNLTWTGNLAAGAAATITYSVTVKSPDTGDKSLANTVTSTTAGSNCASGSADSRCSVTVSVLTPGLTIVKTADVSTTSPGATVHYTVTVTDSGQTPYTGASYLDQLDGVIDDATYNNNATATTGSVTYAAPDLTWTGNLAVGASATITYSVTVNNPDNGDRFLANSVVSATAGSNCPSGGTDARCKVTVRDLVPGLDIAKRADAVTTTPGSVVHYTITVTNTGATAYTGAAFTDPLTGVLDDATYNANASATSGSVSYTSPNLTWTGNLAVGAAATITYSVTVNNPDTGNATLANTITSATAGNNCASGSTDADCTVTVKVAQLTIVNSADVASTVPGGVVRYTATFTNTGQVPYSNVTVATDATDVFDDAVPNGDQTASSGTLILTSTGVSWNGFIGVGATITVTGTVTVKNPDPGNKTMTSTLTSAAPGNNCPSGSTDPQCTVSVTVLTPGLTIAKSADVSTTSPGATVHYTVTVTNSGQTPYTGATYTDQLDGVVDDATYNNDAAATTGSVAYSAPDMTWTGNLAVGASATITYSVTVNSPDTGDKTLANTVVSATPGSNCAAGSSDARCSVTVQDLVPGLDIVKRADAATTTPGSVVHYTITVTNTGATAYTGAAFTDPLTGVLDDATYNNNASASSGTASFASPNLTWTGNLAVGAAATITYSVTVKNPDTGNATLTNTITSTTVGNTCASGSNDVDCAVTVKVAQLTILNQANVSTTTPGGVVRYTATFTNTGQVPYAGITVATDATDVFDDAIPNGDSTATSGSLTLTSTGVSWTGNIAVGGVVTVTGTVTVKNPDTGNQAMTSVLVSSAAGNNCASGSSDPQCSVTVTVLTPGLTITKTADTATAAPGATVGYTITVANTGQTAYTGATVTDPLAGVLDDADYNGDAAASAGSPPSFTSPNLTWTGNLAVGVTVTITYSVTVHSPDTGDKSMTNTVTSTNTGSTCPPASGNASCTASVIVLTPGLTLVKTADTATAVPGQVVNYTITVTNSGQTAYTGATFADDLSTVLDEADYNDDAAVTSGPGSVIYASPELTWTGNLAVGASATVTYSVTVHNPETGDLTLGNAVVSATAGSNCASGSADTRCAASVAVVSATTLTFTKTADAPSATAGGVVNYTITVANSGLSTYSGATFSDDLTGVLDDASFNGTPSATAGTASFTSPDLTWTGDVPASGSVTVTYSVTVDDPDTGNKILANTISSTSPDSNCAADSTDPRCTASVTVSQLVIASTYPASATPGSVFHISTTFTNTGQTPYFGITISVDGRDLIDDATVNGDQTISSGTLVDTGTGAYWTGDIPVGGTVTITAGFTVRNPDPGNQVIKSTWITDAPGSNCPFGSTDPGCTTTIDVLTPALTITKAADATFALPGQVVTYTITVHNTGQTPYTGATVADPLTGILPDADYDNNATASTGSVTYTSPNLAWTGNLAVGATATFTYSVTVHNPPTDGKILTNSASSTDTGSTCPPASPNPACTITMAVLTPALTIAKTADTTSTAPGDTVHYTITVTNSGQTAYTGATFTDNLTGMLDDATYNDDASKTSGSSLTYVSPNLTWTGNLAVGASATITYSVTATNPNAGDNILTNVVTSATTGSNCPSGGSDPRCLATVNVAELTLLNTADVATTTPGSDVHYTVTATNNGQVAYIDANFTINYADLFEDASYNGDVAATAGTVTLDDTAQTATWTGDLAPGASVTVTFSATVLTPDDSADKTFTETVDSTTPGNNCPVGGSDPACTASVTVLVPALTIVKTAGASVVAPGGVVHYTITVTDSGDTAYTDATVTDDLTGVLDEAAYNNDATATAGTATFATPVLTWTGDLAVGASATITYSVTVDNPVTGGKLLANAAVSSDAGSTCPPGSQNTACAITVGVLTPALSITKTADTSTTLPGGVVHYTITVANTGQVPYTGATFTDPLTGVLDDATYNADASATVGTPAYTAPNLTWTGNLALGASAVVTYSVTVHNPDGGDHILANTVTSTTSGDNCPVGNTRAHCTAIVDVAALTILNTADVATTTPGSDVGYTFLVTNSGQVPIADANVTAHFAGVLDDATYNGDVAATSGSISINPVAHAATWTGDLSPGDAVTITGSFTVNNPDTGNKTLTEYADSTTSGSNCPVGGTDPACATTVTVLLPALTITKTADVATTTPGSVVAYTITVHNTGQTPYTGAAVTDDLTGVLGDATYDANEHADIGTVSYTSPNLTWTGDLAVGDTATITYSVTVANPDTGDKLLANTVSSTDAGANCPPGGTDPACSANVQDLIPALAITKTADASSTAPGDTVHYTITVHNTGQTPYTAAAVTDDLTAVLDAAVYNDDAIPTAGTVSYTSPDLTWTGNLALGASVTITYSVTVNDPATGDLDLDNIITSTAPGNNCPPASADPACSVSIFVFRGTLSITVPAAADLGATAPGGTTNAGLGTITVTDNRALAAATWTATVAATDFTTGGATTAETIPAGAATYFINTLNSTTGSATFTPVPVTVLSATPHTVVTTTGADGDNSATWDPAVQVAVPPAAVAGTYTATITHSVS